MAIGDQSDIAARLRGYLPQGWFPVAGLSGTDPAPVLATVLNGFALVLSACYGLLNYVRLQTRIQTATDGFLDLVARDFFGTQLTRQTNQTDASFRTAILWNLLLTRVTRAGLIAILQNLTGRAPIVFEPARPMDVFCLGTTQNAGLGVARLGSYAMPGQILVTAFRPLAQGIPYVAGLGTSYAGLSASYFALPDPASAVTPIPDSAIYAAVDGARAAGTLDWVSLQS